LVSQGTKKRIAVYDESTNSWHEFIASGSTIPLMESGIDVAAVRARVVKSSTEKRMGAVVPLIPLPMDDSAFTQAASIIKKHPAQDVFVVVDSDTIKIPNLETDKKLRNWIRFLKGNGAKVLGKVNTGFAVGEMDTVIDLALDRWETQYPDIDGIYLDNVAQYERTTQGFYKPLVEDIRKQGFKYVVGSLGTAIPEINTTPENVEALVRDVDFDVLILYEGKNFPESAVFAQGWMQKYPRSKLGIIVTGVDADENVQKMQDWVMQIVGTHKAVGYVYVNSDPGARDNNPYRSLSSLFDVQLQTMDMLAEAEGNTKTRADAKAFETPSPSLEYSRPRPEGELSVKFIEPTQNTVRDLEKDVNGIRKIYPDATAVSDFQQWFFNERDPTKDPQFKDWENSNLRRMQDGSNAWYVDGSGKSKGQVRIAGWSKKGTYWEDATELTIYFKWLNDLKTGTPGKYFQVYLRGGDHSNQKGRGGEASCYKARITTTGQVYLVKEIQHDPPGYTNNIPGRKITFPKGSIKGQWVGMKLVVYNIRETGTDGKVYVKVECWIDSTCTAKDGSLDISKQKWVKTAEHVDRGGWRCKDMKKPTKYPSVDYNSKTPDVRQPDEIISKPGGTKDGNLGAYRTDNRATCFRYFNIRQIQNPSHAD
jgi:hypothetical protein